MSESARGIECAGDAAGLVEPCEEDAAGVPRDVLISIRAITKSYISGNGEETQVLKGVTLDIAGGSFNVIRGESGSGKTSLLKILGLLDRGHGGVFVFSGEPLENKPEWYRDEMRANNIGFIFQEGQLFSHMSIEDNAGVPVRLQGSKEQRHKLKQYIASIAPIFFNEAERSAHILSNRPSRVSGGQKQRAAVMRSIVNKPVLILADEPTASLDQERKHEILNLLLQFRDAGHTVVVVSHDKIFHDHGRQLELSDGVVRDLSTGPEAGLPNRATALARLTTRQPDRGRRIWYGWLPRAPLAILIRQAAVETFFRPIFLILVLVSLCVGVCQVGVFASVVLGSQAFLDDAMTRGSRLNRLEIQPHTTALNEPVRFPDIAAIQTLPGIQAIVPRRATVLRVFDASGEEQRYSAMGLQTGDPEYGLLNFVAGGPFTASNEELEVIVTAALLNDLFADSVGLGDRSRTYADFIGRTISAQIPQFSHTAQELIARAWKVQLKIVGIILFAEGGRQLYLPNRTQLVFDRYKMDRDAKIAIPTNENGDEWAVGSSTIEELAAFPWEDRLQVYTQQIRDIIPVFQELSKLGYKPTSDIWNYKWVLDVRDLAWKIFIPLLVLITAAAGLTIATNLFSSAKLREAEFALWRILGMRRGDLVATQIVATILMVLVGTGLGLAIGVALVETARGFLVAQGAGYEKVFAPVDQFYGLIAVSATLIGIAASIYPAIRTARADPARILQS
jgi:ABC-type lipoprotein export system ATPase subunit/ABC-type lipoprotein release transport system permease subunit